MQRLFVTSSNARMAAICLTAAAAAIVLDSAPASFSLTADETERDAELLRVGKYPQKNLTVTTADLDHICAQFSADTVPIRVQHVASPLDPFGTVKRVWRDGERLLGRVSFDALVVPFLASRPVKALSCGLDWLDPTKKAGLVLSELSLVLQGHVPTAALLSDGDQAQQIADLQAKFAKLDADARITDLKRQGKLVPAVELLARKLLTVPEGAAVTLADGSAVNIADTAFALLSALPASVKFVETMPNRRGAQLYGGAAGAAASEESESEDLPELTPAQHDYCVNVLKVDPMKVRQQMKAGAASAGGSD